jgi:pilus assembly protein CpaC
MLKQVNYKVVLMSFLLTCFALISVNTTETFAANKHNAQVIPAAKGVESFSKDWLKQEFQKFSLNANTVESKSLASKSSGKVKPIAYQQIEDFSNNDMDIGPLPDEDTNFQDVKGGVTDIRATVGKSQIIEFAQPIKRLAITDPSLADLILLSPTQMILNGKSAGVTSMIIWDELDQPAFFDLYVQNDTSDLLDAFRKVAPDEPINIKITDDGNVILSGTVSSTIVRDQLAKISEAYGYKLVDVAESPVPQVILELKIAEIARSVTKNFSFFYKVGAWADVSIAPNFTNSPRDPNGGIGGEWNGNSETGFTAAIFKPNARFSAIMGMAQTRGLLNILAEPTIVSTNGREAKFDAGNSVPVPTGVDQNGNLAYEYKDVGIVVTFTPWISEKSQRVELTLSPEVSEIDPSVTISQPNGVTIFGFRKRKATTTVELENGETLMIAGLITRSNTNSYTSPPFFGDLPYIGRFFQTSTFDKSETELVIMVTPRIVTPGEYGGVLGTSE